MDVSSSELAVETPIIPEEPLPSNSNGGTAVPHSELTPEDSEVPPPSNSNGGAASSVPHSELTPEELVAKAIAPVKKEYLQLRTNRTSNNTAVPNDDVSEAKSANIFKEKKSKRQLKRERQQQLKSPLHLCQAVSKTGKPSACQYGEKCRFSHDIEAFKAQKPEDIEGTCPFLDREGPCPYGLSCRFAGTHKDDDGDVTLDSQKNSSEVNGLKKDVQKLLWKNSIKFTKADASLKLLGLVGQGRMKKLEEKEKEEDDQTIVNGPDPVDDNGIDVGPIDSVSDETRPVKKAKTLDDEPSCCVEVNNTEEKDTEKSSEQNDVMSVDDQITPESDECLKIHPREKKIIDFRDKLYLAPLTTVGNLPFRRVCKVLGADITCGEMAMCTNLLQGQASEWALLRRHSSENLFGVQICGAYPDTVAKAVELIEQECSVDFIDINMGCPIDLVVNKGAGSALLTKPMRIKNVIQAASNTVNTPITIKVRTGYFEGKNKVDSIIGDIGKWGASAVTIHGRSRQQRYSKLADWEYINECVMRAPHSLPVLGNGDVFSYLDWNKHKSDSPQLSTCMIARGALVKPWIFTEIKEQRHWDISSSERLDILKDYARFGLEHWGSDTKGVETTRRFLLELLSYMFRYVPVGLLEVVPQKINWRPPAYFGRNELETMMASDSAADWIRISEMVLGKVPDGFTFAPKHKSNAYDKAENG